MTRIWLFFGTMLIFFSACVPSKKLIYLQKDDLKNRKGIPKDTVLRTHTLSIQEYRIQPLDILSIHFETLSDCRHKVKRVGAVLLLFLSTASW
jgi:polysaccharide export outer membrane protein